MRFALIITHLGSGGGVLSKILNDNPRLKSYPTNTDYNHPSILSYKAAIIDQAYDCYPGITYFDKLVYNHQLSCKEIYKLCKFIYLVREPLHTLPHIVNKNGYSPYCAFSYYCFRLRRMCEMAKKTSRSLLLTYDNLLNGSAFPILNEFLDLKEPLDSSKISNVQESEEGIPLKLQMSAKIKHDYYLDYLNRHLGSPIHSVY